MLGPGGHHTLTLTPSSSLTPSLAEAHPLLHHSIPITAPSLSSSSVQECTSPSHSYAVFLPLPPPPHSATVLPLTAPPLPLLSCPPWVLLATAPPAGQPARHRPPPLHRL